MDRVCVKMPDDPRDFMVASAVMQDYTVRLAVGAQRNERDQEYEVTYRMSDVFTFMEPCFQVVKENVPVFDYTGWSTQIRGDFGCFIDFDTTRAKNLTYKFPDAHSTEAFGILIGGGPLGIITGCDIPRWPILSSLNVEKPLSPKPKVAVGMWDETESIEFYGMLRENYSHATESIDFWKPTDLDPHTKLVLTSQYDIIIGPGSYTTYVAGSLEKAVIEIFSSREEAYWYNSTGLPCYKALLGKPNADYVYKVWEKLWPEYLSLINNSNIDTKVDTLPVYCSADVI